MWKFQKVSQNGKLFLFLMKKSFPKRKTYDSIDIVKFDCFYRNYLNDWT